MPNREIQLTVLALTRWNIVTTDGLADYMNTSKRLMQRNLQRYVEANLIEKVDGVYGNGWTITEYGKSCFSKS